MAANKNDPVDSETILMTLDQIGQTIDIMTSVVGRLRGYITEQAEQPNNPNNKQSEDVITITHQGNSQIIH